LKKLFLALTFTAVSLFAMNFQTASKSELMTIKGIGEKRAASIIKYRKSNKIRSAADLKNINGIGAEIADNAKRGIKNSDKKVGKAKKSVSKKTSSSKDKISKKAKKSKEKTSKRVKKKAGDATKRSEKKAKKKNSKAKKDSKKKVKK